MKSVEQRGMVLQPFGEGGGPSLIQIADALNDAIEVAADFILQTLPGVYAVVEGAVAVDVS